MASNNEIENAQASSKKRCCGKYCAVAGCSNRQSTGHTLHSWPSDKQTGRIWTKFVSTCRADFGPSFGTPSKYSAICSHHFEKSCYPQSVGLMESFGFKTTKHLLPGSVPTIQKPFTLHCATKTSTTTSLTVTQTTSCSSNVALTSTTVSRTTAPVCSVGLMPSKIKVRGAFQKRERQRILEVLCSENVSVSTLPSKSIVDNVEVVQGTQVDFTAKLAEKPQTVHTSCQTVITPYLQPHGTANTYCRAKVRSKYTQIQPRVSTKAVQCRIVTVPTFMTQSTQWDKSDLAPYHYDQPKPDNSDTCIDENMNVGDETGSDFDYTPSCTETETDAETNSPIKLCKRSSESRMRKFIVFESKLLELFDRCHRCHKPAYRKIAYVDGTMVQVKQDCGHCQQAFTWNSQPFIKNIPAGNLLLSAGILFSGSVPCKAIRCLQHMGLSTISVNTFMNHQSAFLQPAVHDVWQSWLVTYVGEARRSGSPLLLGGDGRSDSPGHCAKFGTYTLIDLKKSQICNIQLVQSNEAGNSSRMEKMGLERAVQFLTEEGLRIGELVTDRHPQIVKYMKGMKETTHSIDIWHVAKGLKKKLSKLASEKDCRQLSEWIKSILNHLYWVAASTPEADAHLMVQKWTSLGNHIHNKHTHEGQLSFPVCVHPPLEGERKKKWLKEGSKVSTKMLEIIHSRQLTKDVGMLATGPQTASVEAFHSVINHFAPKMVGFSYEGILCRTFLAALHFNENNNRKQAVNQDGCPRYSVSFKKPKGDFILRETKEEQTFNYVEILMEKVIEQASSATLSQMKQHGKERPRLPPLCSAVQKPSKEVLQNNRSRYSKKLF